MKINVGIDWDGCASTNPAAFLLMAKILKEAGYGVYVVTMRYPSEAKNHVPDDWMEVIDGLHCTSREAKEKFMREQGIVIHIWMDDNPKSIHMSAFEIWGNSTPEGTVVSPDYGVDPEIFYDPEVRGHVVKFGQSDSVMKIVGEKLATCSREGYYLISLKQLKCYHDYKAKHDQQPASIE